MNLKEIVVKIKENLQWFAIGLIVGVLLVLVIFVSPYSHIAALCLLAAVGAIEAYLIWKGKATITHFYIPQFPHRIDWPIALGTPIVLIVKAAMMWTNREALTVWWVASAIIVSWIAAHLCSFEKNDQGR